MVTESTFTWVSFCLNLISSKLYMNANVKATFILYRGCKIFIPFDLITTLTYVLMDNFCACFEYFLQLFLWYQFSYVRSFEALIKNNESYIKSRLHLQDKNPLHLAAKKGSLWVSNYCTWQNIYSFFYN